MKKNVTNFYLNKSIITHLHFVDHECKDLDLSKIKWYFFIGRIAIWQVYQQIDKFFNFSKCEKKLSILTNLSTFWLKKCQFVDKFINTWTHLSKIKKICQKVDKIGDLFFKFEKTNLRYVYDSVFWSFVLRKRSIFCFIFSQHKLF